MVTKYGSSLVSRYNRPLSNPNLLIFGFHFLYFLLQLDAIKIDYLLPRQGMKPLGMVKILITAEMELMFQDSRSVKDCCHPSFLRHQKPLVA